MTVLRLPEVSLRMVATAMSDNGAEFGRIGMEDNLSGCRYSTRAAGRGKTRGKYSDSSRYCYSAVCCQLGLWSANSSRLIPASFCTLCRRTAFGRIAVAKRHFL